MHSIALRPDPGSTMVTKTTRYSAGGTLDGNGNVIERSFGRPGGVSVTTRAGVPRVWLTFFVPARRSLGAWPAGWTRSYQ
jgi:hypothetical protein